MKEEHIRKIHKKQILFLTGALILSAGALFYWFRRQADQKPEAADFFAYTDTENRLYLWREGSAEPLLLTDHAFALEGEEPDLPYWEAWEYWQEWDEAGDVWVANEEKALRDVVWEAPDGRRFFPENMRWASFGMQRGAAEREEALAYASEEELEDWMKVRAFCYDLYVQPSDTAQEAEKLAENVLFYHVDQNRFVWYCRAVTDKTAEIGEEVLPCTRCVLYRYDGTNNQEIAKINGRKKEPYHVAKGGALVYFYGMDDGLYGARDGLLRISAADGKGDPRDVYDMEMIPMDSFEKIPLSELLGSSLPEDVLRTYAYYLDEYGENRREQAFAWALEACWEREVFEKQSSVYAVTKTGIHRLDGLAEGIVPGGSEDYSEDGEQLYLLQYQSPDMEGDYRRYGHHLYYGYLENRYRLDGEGNCQKIVELADESRVVGNEVFYSRNMGLEGYVDLYRTGREGAVASAADISLKSLQKSRDSDLCLFLAEGLRSGDEEKQIPVYAGADLRAAYRELGTRRDRFSDAENLHTLILCREGMVRELEQNIFRYDFYGNDSVWMLQYEPEETLEEEEHGRSASWVLE